MSVSRRVPALFVFMLMACNLSGCGSVSSFVAGGMADFIPAWAGGLPADAPPRPGTPEYDAYVKQRVNPQQTVGQAGPDPATSPSASAVH